MSSPASPSRHVSDNLLPFFVANSVSLTGLDPPLQLSGPRLQPSTGDRCIIELEMPVLSGGGTGPYPVTQAGVQR